jgi:hypothetical protein
MHYLLNKGIEFEVYPLFDFFKKEKKNRNNFLTFLKAQDKLNNQ